MSISASAGSFKDPVNYHVATILQWCNAWKKPVADPAAGKEIRPTNMKYMWSAFGLFFSWRAPGMRARLVPISFIFIQFSVKICQIIGWRPPWKILDPPLTNKTLPVVLYSLFLVTPWSAVSWPGGGRQSLQWSRFSWVHRSKHASRPLAQVFPPPSWTCSARDQPSSRDLKSSTTSVNVIICIICGV